jgi:hypothetical protein
MGNNEIGSSIPKIGYKKFIKNPINIMLAILKPTLYNIVSIFPNLCNLKILKINNPGTKVKYIKHINCLNRGI